MPKTWIFMTLLNKIFIENKEMGLKLSFVILNSGSESPVSRHIYQGAFPAVFWGFLLIEWKFVRDQEYLTGQQAHCVGYEYNRDEIHELKCIILYLISSGKYSDKCWVWRKVVQAEDRSGRINKIQWFPFLVFPAFPWDVHSPSSELILQWLNERGIYFPCVDGWEEGEMRRWAIKQVFLAASGLYKKSNRLSF